MCVLDANRDMQDRVFDFYEDPEKSSKSGITHLMIEQREFGLEMADVTVYTADNSSIN